MSFSCRRAALPLALGARASRPPVKGEFFVPPCGTTFDERQPLGALPSLAARKGRGMAGKMRPNRPLHPTKSDGARTRGYHCVPWQTSVDVQKFSGIQQDPAQAFHPILLSKSYRIQWLSLPGSATEGETISEANSHRTVLAGFSFYPFRVATHPTISTLRTPQAWLDWTNP